MRELTTTERRNAAATLIRGMLEDAGFERPICKKVGRMTGGIEIIIDVWTKDADSVIVRRHEAKEGIVGLEVYVPACRSIEFKGTVEALEKFLNQGERNGSS